MQTVPGPNVLIDNFTDEDRAAFLAVSTPVDFSLGQVIYEGGDQVTHCIFVEQGIISAVASMEDGRTVESYMVGSEGATSVWIGDGPFRGHSRLAVQVAGNGRRIEAGRLQTMLDDRPGVRAAIGECLAGLRNELEQSGACNALHRSDQRFAKWLLRCHDRTEGDVLRLTQEYLASMLGSQRTTVNEAAQGLARAGAIRYSRGKLQILDRGALERAACECYGRTVDPKVDSDIAARA